MFATVAYGVVVCCLGVCAIIVEGVVERIHVFREVRPGFV